MKEAKILLTSTEPCLNPEFPQEQLKNYRTRKIWVSLRGPTISCKEMCGTIWWVGEQNDSTTLSSINSMHWWPLQRRNEIREIIVKKFAHKLFWNAYTWHVLEDLIFFGQWTNLHDRAQNGPNLVTNDYLVWSLTFIILVNTNNIVMWVTLQNSADWDCFKTLTSREILKIRNPLLEEHCASLEVMHWFQSVGCVRNKLQFRTVQPNQKSFLLDAVLRLDGISSLDLWHLIVAVLHGNTNQSHKERRDQCTNQREVRAAPHKLQKGKKSHEWFMILMMLITFPQTSILLVRKLKFVCVWRQRSSDQRWS